jgi:hypothetical protein
MPATDLEENKNLDGWIKEVDHFESVIRSAGFQPDAGWRKMAKEYPRWLEEVNSECGELMRVLGYQ